jgi:hypothetical protein
VGGKEEEEEEECYIVGPQVLHALQVAGEDQDVVLFQYEARRGCRNHFALALRGL